MRKSLLFLCSFILFACAPATQTTAQQQVVTVYASSAAEPWMSDLLACADQQSIILNVTANSPQIYLQVGEPENLVFPAYQIDEERIFIVAHRESPVQNLSLAEAQALFAGGGDASVQVWVYAKDVDLQILFDQFVMKERSVTSSARLASSAQEMSDVLNAESNAVGILPEHWKTGNVREVYLAGTAPVLAITQMEPQNGVAALIGCLQRY